MRTTARWPQSLLSAPARPGGPALLRSTAPFLAAATKIGWTAIISWVRPPTALVWLAALSAHSYLAEQVAHLDAGDIAAARRAASTDPKTAAILAFAAAVNDGRGTVTSQDLATARAAGLSEKEIAKTIGHVALNVLTNYFNKAARVAIDFPAVAA